MIYKILSILLSYPSQQLMDELSELKVCLERYYPELIEPKEFIVAIEELDLYSLQENYVATFDRNSKHALHLFEHLHGEDRARGQAMLDLLHEYQQRGLEPQGGEFQIICR